MEFYETHQEYKAFECFQCNVFSADTHANEESSDDILTNEEETKIDIFEKWNFDVSFVAANY